MLEIRIRTGTVADVEAIMQVHRKSILGLGRASYTEAECKSWSAGLVQSLYQKAMTSDGETYLVAENWKSLVGFCSYKDNEIIGLYVDPDTSRIGVGTKLLAAAEDQIVSHNPASITLNAALSALAFYQSHGYRMIRTRRWTTRGGLEIDVCEMKKDAA